MKPAVLAANVNSTGLSMHATEFVVQRVASLCIVPPTSATRELRTKTRRTAAPLRRCSPTSNRSPSGRAACSVRTSAGRPPAAGTTSSGRGHPLRQRARFPTRAGAVGGLFRSSPLQAPGNTVTRQRLFLGFAAGHEGLAQWSRTKEQGPPHRMRTVCLGAVSSA